MTRDIPNHSQTTNESVHNRNIPGTFANINDPAVVAISTCESNEPLVEILDTQQITE